MQSNYNAPKYGGPVLAKVTTFPEPSMTVVEPFPFRQDLSPDAIKLRYSAVTGFRKEALVIVVSGIYFTASILHSRLGVVNGTGRLVGGGGVTANRSFDTFTIQQLESAEHSRL